MPGNTRRWFAGGAIAAVIAALMMATAAFANGANTVSQTEIIKNQVIDTDTNGNPCSGAPGTFTLFAKNAIAHVTVNDKDSAKRERRLNLLMRFRDAVNRVADFSRIEG